jgi:hypothetical protein
VPERRNLAFVISTQGEIWLLSYRRKEKSGFCHIDARRNLAFVISTQGEIWLLSYRRMTLNAIKPVPPVPTIPVGIGSYAGLFNHLAARINKPSRTNRLPPS